MQIFKISIFPCSSVEAAIMSNNNLFIFCEMTVHFEHVSSHVDSTII